MTKRVAKPKAAKPPPPYGISHSVKGALIEFLVKPEKLKGDKTAWPREMKLLTELIPQYPEADFWSGLDLGFKLNSLAFFKMDDGANELAEKWRLYQYGKTLSNQLDTTIKPAMIEDAGVDLVPPKRMSPLDWADSV